MDLINYEIQKQIENLIIQSIIRKQYKKCAEGIELILDRMYDEIPDNKRISYGLYYTIKTLSKHLFQLFQSKKYPVLKIVENISSSTDSFKVKSVCLGIAALYEPVSIHEFDGIIEFFKKQATDDNWIARENAAGFFQMLIKKDPEKLKPILIQLATSNNPKLRRFACESLRPVSDNRWLQNNPKYSLSIIIYLFSELDPYPRTSVGNNLSDLSRRNPDLVFSIVEKLVQSHDKNSYWIAYRACRNLIKKYPERVFEILEIDEYRYKKNIYKK